MKKLTISGGSYKNYKLTCPPGEIRPVMNLMREAIFQILEHSFLQTMLHNSSADDSPAHSMQKLRFLDLFTGSGLMAIEAVSRGMGYAHCVEIDKQKWASIYKNIAVAGKKIILAKEAAERFVIRNNKKFDVIYADPPFNYKYKVDLLEKIVASRCCFPHTLIILHMPKKENFPQQVGDFELINLRNYGGSAVHFFQRPK